MEEDDSPSPMDDMVEGYGDMHKLVLQGIMSAGFLDAKGVKTLFKGACKALKLGTDDVSMQEVQKIVREINEQIKPFDMAIRSASCELTGKKFYVFLVTVEKPIMKLQTMFSKSELELFQKIMTAVLRKYKNFAVPVADCLNLAREIDTRNLSIEMADSFIKKMITLQYLGKYYLDSKTQDYEITIGIRTIREFEPILREVYDDVMTNCNLCKMIMLHGYNCPKCNLFVHKACFVKYLQTCKNCPGCKITWKEKEMVKRVRQDPAEMHSPTNVPSTSRGTRKSQQSNEDMPVLQPMVTSPSKRGHSKSKSKTPSPTKVTTTKSKTKKGSKASPTKSTGSKGSPTKTAAAKTAAAKAGPSKTATAKASPTKTAPAKGSPAKTAPASKSTRSSKRKAVNRIESDEDTE